MDMEKCFLAIKERLSENSTMALRGDTVQCPISASFPPLYKHLQPQRPFCCSPLHLWTVQIIRKFFLTWNQNPPLFSTHWLYSLHRAAQTLTPLKYCWGKNSELNFSRHLVWISYFTNPFLITGTKFLYNWKKTHVHLTNKNSQTS